MEVILSSPHYLNETRPAIEIERVHLQGAIAFHDFVERELSQQVLHHLGWIPIGLILVVETGDNA